MPINLDRATRPYVAETRTITITAPAEVVHRFVSDPANLPRWAPDVASRIREEDGHWLAETPHGESEIVVTASPDEGTIDLRLAVDPVPSVCSRVVANGASSEFTFTQFVDPTAGRPELEEQMAIVEEELEAVRELVEIDADAIASPPQTVTTIFPA